MATANPKAVRNRLQDLATRPVEAPTRGSKGMIVSAFDRALQDADHPLSTSERRYLVWGFCFCDPSGAAIKPLRSADLTPGQWFALKQWVGAAKAGEEWAVRATFAEEARWVLALAVMVNLLLTDHPGFTFQEWLNNLEARGGAAPTMNETSLPIVQTDTPLPGQDRPADDLTLYVPL